MPVFSGPHRPARDIKGQGKQYLQQGLRGREEAGRTARVRPSVCAPAQGERSQHTRQASHLRPGSDSTSRPEGEASVPSQHCRCRKDP